MFDLGATVCTGSRPDCPRCPVRRQCRWHQRGLSDPDPWRSSPSVRVHSPFTGSDRQGRGRLLDVLRHGAVAPEALGAACGWPDDQERAERITDSLVAEGFAEWAGGPPARLRLR